MIKLIHKPANIELKGDGTSIYKELEGVPIQFVDFNYYDFCVRDALFDSNAGGNVIIKLENDDYWIFNVTGIDIQTIRNLKDAEINIYELIPENLTKMFQFQWKSFLNSQGRTREYSLVTYEFLPCLYDLLKHYDVKIMADDDLRKPYFRISSK